MTQRELHKNKDKGPIAFSAASKCAAAKAHTQLAQADTAVMMLKDQ